MQFDGSFIFVTIPFDKTGFAESYGNTTQKTTQKTTQVRIVDLLLVNPHLTRKDLSRILKLSEDGVKYHLNQLKKKGNLKRIDGDKRGHWEITK